MATAATLADVEVTGPLPDLWAGIEGFDEEQADGAFVGLLWDVPLADVLARVVIAFLEELGDRWRRGPSPWPRALRQRVCCADD